MVWRAVMSASMAKMDRDKVFKDFTGVLNMKASEMESWLQRPESRQVGFKREGARESVGHTSGRRILGILRKQKSALTDEDYAHMRKVVGYVRRHLAQEPQNIATSRWRYSLMNWGHDPLKS